MNSEEISGILILSILLVLAIGFILMVPIHGSIFGYEINIPLIGWIAVALIFALGFVMYIKSSASR